ncbi:MAG TPA: hypothetical protein VI094_00720 [Propionibacteriaceae bacterium]
MTAALHLYIQLQDALTNVSVPLRIHLAARVLQDALTEATADYWERRAQTFEDAAPKLGEYHGTAPRDELNEAWTRCHATAAACRRHAQLLLDERSEEISDEVTSVLVEEVA